MNNIKPIDFGWDICSEHGNTASQHEIKVIKNKKEDPTLEEAQKFVGGYVERVPILNNWTYDYDGVLLVDEDARLKDKSLNLFGSYDNLKCDSLIGIYIFGNAIFIPSNIKSDWHK